MTPVLWNTHFSDLIWPVNICLSWPLLRILYLLDFQDSTFGLVFFLSYWLLHQNLFFWFFFISFPSLYSKVIFSWKSFSPHPRPSYSSSPDLFFPLRKMSLKFFINFKFSQVQAHVLEHNHHSKHFHNSNLINHIFFFHPIGRNWRRELLDSLSGNLWN